MRKHNQKSVFYEFLQDECSYREQGKIDNT